MIRRLATTFVPMAAALAFALGAASAAVQEQCRTIKFERGASSADVRGTAPADGVDCLRFSTGDGQNVQLSVSSAGNAVAFTVDGVADGRDSHQFRSTRTTYEVSVFQTMKAVSPVNYVLKLTIR